MGLTKYLLALSLSALLVGSYSVLAAHTGLATFYDPGLTFCGFANTTWELVTALNPVDYGDGENCGRMVQVNYEGRSIRVEVVDQCPTCDLGGMDLSRAAFESLTGDLRLGTVPIEWEYV